MKEELRFYLDSLINGVPHYMYERLLYFFCIGAVLIIAWKRRRAWKGISWLLLAEYIFLIYCSTVIFRVVKGVREYDYTPFWSYHRPELLVENIMNVVVFVPVGLLLGCASRGMRWWMALLIGMGVSVSIEALQLVFKRGFSEFDDVFHNTLGCMIGYGVAWTIYWQLRRESAVAPLARARVS